MMIIDREVKLNGVPHEKPLRAIRRCRWGDEASAYPAKWHQQNTMKIRRPRYQPSSNPLTNALAPTGHKKIKQLWEYLAQYCYLPRLFDQEVLLTAVRNGIRRIDAPLAYATGISNEGYHTGLLYQAAGQVYFDDQSILIHPEHIKIAPPPPPKPGTGPLPTTQVSEPKPGLVTTTVASPEPQPTTRYYGRVALNPQRVNREMGLIVEEVIERLTSLVGCDVEISLEISAKLPEGFDEATIRTVSENSRTLKFAHHEFEKD
ncbi:MAG: hypothetical protein H6668_08675 [Ardenticatenaceae bacterium]|nr:hypothetical protein [Ardenticatenaceae bacterium]